MLQILFFNIYRSSQLTIASRYHANVCSLVFGVPTIGLSPLQRI
ncbi:polysaccharide pyruvyl transferase family protein [Shewanella algae]